MASQKIKRFAFISALVAIVIVAALLFFVRLRPQAAISKCLVSTYALDDRMSDLPRIILWAWERPEDLRFINSQEIGVAYLAESIILRGDRTIIRPRFQPLAFAPDTKRIAVVRIETDGATRPLLSDEQHNRIVAELTKLAQGDSVAVVQIDFDALKSERTFYRGLLVDLRKQLPQATRLSITALASWCWGDNWIADLPIDEAVPMLFRMGADSENIWMRLKAGDDFSVPVARHSVGISTDESPATGFKGRRVYVFNTRPWSAQRVNQLISEVQQWQ